ncbi:MAG: hypothetical protein JHC33_12205 [Ignisphaera sp.]|nr:hypothetical protein [Ignisphaera sp.]
MSNRLRLFNSMSGMQKSIVEDSKKEINALADKVASDTLAGTMGKKKSPAMLTHEVLQAEKASDADLEKIKKDYEDKLESLNTELKRLKLQRTQAERHLASEESKDDLDIEKIKSIQKRLTRLSSDVNKTIRAISLAEADRDEDIEKAERKLRSGKARQSKKTRAEQGISTKKLEGINPLVVPIKTNEIGPGNLTFSQMSSIAHRDAYAEDTKDLINFDDAINNLNKAIGFMLPEFLNRVDKKNPIFSDPGVKKVFSSIKPDDVSIGQIEKNADLIKIFWIYLGGDEILQTVKKSQNFINALTKLEKGNKNPVTKPIITITSVDDMFTSEAAKEVFGYFKHFVDNNPQDIVNSILLDAVTDIAEAPDSLYSGFSTSTSENVADTMYYSFINAFGTPEDKVLLLKRTGTSGKKGLAGSSAYFLAKPAIDALNLKIKDLARVAEDEKVSPSRSRHTSWGTRNVNTQYEKYMGGKVIGAIGGKYLGTKAGSDVQEENLLKLIGKVFDITRPVNAGYALANQIEEIQTQLKAVLNPSVSDIEERANELAIGALTDAGKDAKKELAIVPKKDPEVIEILKAARIKAVNSFSEESKELQKELTGLTKQHTENASQVLVDIRKLFLSGTPEEVLSQIKQMFQNRFDAVKQTMEEDLATLRKRAATETKLGTQKIDSNQVPVKSPTEVKIMDLSGAIAASDDYMGDFLASLDKLQKEDVEILAELFKASVHPEETKDSKATLGNKLITSKEDGKLIVSWIKDIITAFSKYEVQVPGTIGKDQAEIGLEKRVSSIQASVYELETEIKTIKAKKGRITDKDSQELEAITNELNSLMGVLDEAEKDLNEYKAELVKMGKSGVTTAGDKRLANTYKTAFTSLLYNQGGKEVKKSIDIIELRKLLNRMPSDIFKYLDARQTSKATDILDTLDPSNDSEFSAQTTAWKKRVRKALHKFFNHLAASDVKEDADRFKTLKTISIPFTSELETVSEYDSLDIKPDIEGKDGKLIDLEAGDTSAELTDDAETAALQAKIKRLKSRIAKNQKSGKSTWKDKKALRRLEKNKKTTEGLVSFEPGSVLAGNAVATTDSNMANFLLNNAKNLEANARAFYNEILSIVNNLGLVNSLHAKESPFSEGNTKFIDAVIQLVQKFKAELSTSPDASDLEDSMFLKKLVQAGKIKLGSGDETEDISPNTLKTTVDPEEVRNAFLEQDDFVDFLGVLNQAVADNSIWYEKKVINAPVIENFNLKSATLLNMMSCIKNFDSIEAFDLSENRRNKNVLAEILDIKNYPKSFTLYSSTAVMMKLYFLMSLKQSIDRVNVIGQFSEEFITNDIIPPDKTDKKIDAIIAKLNSANAVFEQTILREFEEDFGQGGNLDKEIKDNLDILWDLASNTGNVIYSLKDGSLTPVPVTQDSLKSIVLQQGVECIGAFNAEMLKKDAVILNLLALFDRNKSENRDAKLQQCISIIKTGINFYVGFEARKIIGEHQFYDKELKQKDIQKFDEAMNQYYDNPEFAAFTSTFSTKINKDPSLPYQATSKVANEAKDGFMNLNNAFLMAFLKDFSTEAITKSVTALDLEQAELADPTSDKKIEAEAAVEKAMPIFLSGIFKKGAGVNEESTLDLDTEEAQKHIEKTVKGNLKKTEKLLQTGEVQGITPINVTSEGEGEKKVLKLSISIRQEGSYSKIKPEEEGKRLGSMATKSGIVTNDKGEKTSGTTLTQLNNFASLVKMFSTSLESVSNVLQRVYSTDPALCAEIKAYSDSISSAAPNVIKALLNISQDTYNKELQEAAISLLSEINALEPPDPEAVGELTSPTTTYNKALKSFKDDNSIFNAVYSFAQEAAADIERRNITVSDILSAINEILAGDSAKYASAELPKTLKDTTDAIIPTENRLLNADEIDKFAELLFTRPLTEEAVLNILNSIKASLGSLPKEVEDKTPDVDPVEAKFTSKIETAESAKRGKETQIVKLNSVIETLEKAAAQEAEAAEAAKPVERVRPTNLAPFVKGPLTPEDQAATKARMDASFAGAPTENLPVPGEYLNTTPPVEPEDGITESRRDVDLDIQRGIKKPTPAPAPLQERITQAKGDLAKTQNDIIDLDKEIESTKEALARYKDKQAVVAMIEFLSTLYKNGVSTFNALKAEIASEDSLQVKQNLYKIKFKPIKSTVPVIISFIKKLKAESEVTPVEGQEPKANVADPVLHAFVNFNIEHILTFEMPKKEVPKEILNNSRLLAVWKFNTLLEELENAAIPEPEVPVTDPTEVPAPIGHENLTDSAYMLGIARFLKEHGFNAAQRWIATDPVNPSESRPGVEGSIQDACMIRFLGKSSGRLNEVFKNFKYCLNSRTFIGFTADLGKTRSEKQGDTVVEIPIRSFVPVQFTKFNLLSKVANGDIEAINSILNPKSDEEE